MMNRIDKTTIEYRSPSNIALVKYWGKKGVQIPMNPSLSFTLSNCFTTTSVVFMYAPNKGDVQFEFLFEGKEKLDFHPKLNTFFGHISKEFTEIKNYQLIINSSNSFPHSSGIASSASAMSALALCLGDFERELHGDAYDFNFDQRVSHWARLGSGSACRSVFPGIAMWGETVENEAANNEYAVPMIDFDPVFKDFKDIVLLVDEGQKQISSTVGHKLMNGHPYANARIEHAKTNLHKLMQHLKSGDLDKFIEVVENEALTLHAMMLSSDPGFFLIREGTLNIIHEIRKFREQEQVKCCFTLDAGANVHFLYQSKDHEVVNKFVQDNLTKYCQNKMYICDQVGNGPERIN